MSNPDRIDMNAHINHIKSENTEMEEKKLIDKMDETINILKSIDSKLTNGVHTPSKPTGFNAYMADPHEAFRMMVN